MSEPETALGAVGSVEVRDVARLKPNPLNPRGEIDTWRDDRQVLELSESIKQVGLLQPITVTPQGTIVTGHRRYLACLMAGIKTVRVIVQQLSEAEQLALMLIENVQRQSLNPIQEAKAYKDLNERGISIESIAQRVGISKHTVAERLNLLRLPLELQLRIIEGSMALGYVPHLLRLKDPLSQMKWANVAEERNYTAKELNDEINKAAQKRERRAEAKQDGEPGIDAVIDTCAYFLLRAMDTLSRSKELSAFHREIESIKNRLSNYPNQPPQKEGAPKAPCGVCELRLVDGKRFLASQIDCPQHGTTNKEDPYLAHQGEVVESGIVGLK